LEAQLAHVETAESSFPDAVSYFPFGGVRVCFMKIAQNARKPLKHFQCEPTRHATIIKAMASSSGICLVLAFPMCRY